MELVLKMEKVQIVLVLVLITMALTAVNTYSLLALGQQLPSMQQPSALAGLPEANNSELQESGPGLKEADPQPSPKLEPKQPAQPTGLADDDAFIGPKDAKVTVVEFSDYECPYCGAAAGTHKQLISQFKSRDPSWKPAVPKLKELAEQGVIKFVYRDFPLSFHQNAQKAAEVAECAGEQEKFWEMHDKIFENQDSIDAASLKQYAKDIGLNSTEFDQCLDSGEMEEEVKKDLADGQKLGIRGTPAFFVNGTLISGAQPFSVLEQAIEAELAKGGS